MESLNPPAIVGEAVAGEASQVRQQINDIIKVQNTSTFTLAKLLHTAKTKQFFVPWGFETFRSFAKSLDLKVTKAYYLTRIVENMMLAGVPEEIYEPVGIAKLRVISKIDPLDDFEGKSGATYIKSLTETAKEVDIETLEEAVAKIQGKTGDDSQVWLNLSMTKAARDNVVLPAIENMRAQVGTVGEKDGEPVDSSDGRCIELISAEFLSGAPSLT